MREMSELKNAARAMAFAIKDADADSPTDKQVMTIVDRGCEVFAGAVRLVKVIWKERDED